MHSLYKATFSTIPQHSSDFPFLPEAGNRRPHQWWSSEFSTSVIPDKTNAQKPDIVLTNCKVQVKSWAHVLTCIELTISDLGTTRDLALFKGVVTKGYLMIREQPWCRFIVLFSIAAWQLPTHYIDHSGLIITHPISIIDQLVHLINTLNTLLLMNCQAHGMDPTIHLCDDIFKGQHSDLANGAIGWVEDKWKDILSIMAILWRSQGLFSRSTICYRIQNSKGEEYALKDYWVDEDKKNHEEDVLNRVRGIPNVVTLIEAWDVEYQNEPDSTSHIHDCHGASRSIAFHCKFHWQMFLYPCREPLMKFTSKRELLLAFHDFVIAHETMLTIHVLHGDLSPNNFIIHKGSSYFIDFDYTQIILPGNTSVCSWGTGTLPYMSIHLLTACATHLEILELIKKWISHEAVDEPLPPTQEADLSSTTHPCHSTQKVILCPERLPAGDIATTSSHLPFTIPKPHGEVSCINCGGYNLQEKLGWSPLEYEEIHNFVTHLTNKYLKVNKM
ncbi:hypothetical protein BDR06DRAFT_975577 [Suillus hirtellus]|nr:hypothetical protein BDR06DRAFT_975577 [Suillus hirtellus]